MSPLFGSGGADAERERRERSADERERARAEREARRAAREGREPRELAPTPMGASPAAPETVLPEPAAHDPEPAAHAPEPAPAAHEPEPTFEPEPVVQEPEPVAHAPEPAPVVHAPEPVAHAPASEPVVHQPDPAYDDATADHPAVVVRGRSDEPVGLKRVTGSSLASAAGASGPPRFGAPPRGIPKRRRGARRVVPLLLLALVAVLAFFAYRLYEPGADAGEGRVTVTIPEGASAGQIGELLADEGIVDSSFFFSLRARLDGENLRSGDLVLRRGMSYEAALAELTKAPPPAPALAKVTLPEGPSRKELAPRVAAAGFEGSYLEASRRSGALDPRDYGAPRSASLEGFLFPATYELKPGSSAKALVNEQVRTFERRFRGVSMRTARRNDLSRYDVLTIASMIEREALVAKDRRLIAGVIYNRLEQGMPLGIDATIRFELENFDSPLKVSELERDTPYNTRTNTGLPPGPIGNPGLASIRAAANPARNDFVYYVVKPCAKGAHAFSSTDAQFQRDVAAYNAKRDELGGKDPSQC